MLYKNVSNFIRKCFYPIFLIGKTGFLCLPFYQSFFFIEFFHFNTFLYLFGQLSHIKFNSILYFYIKILISSLQTCEHVFSLFSNWPGFFLYQIPPFFHVYCNFFLFIQMLFKNISNFMRKWFSTFSLLGKIGVLCFPF